jgi:hypothetical protein
MKFSKDVGWRASVGVYAFGINDAWHTSDLASQSLAPSHWILVPDDAMVLWSLSP